MFYYSQERNGKYFSEKNIQNFKKGYLAGPMWEVTCGRITNTLLRRSFRQEGFPVNTSEFLALLQKSLTRAP